MLPPANFYTSQITPKQKKDLLGIYKDYLYFERGMELALQINSSAGLAALFMKNMDWLDDGINLRWSVNFATVSESKNYIKFANGDIENPEQYGYMSLYHTKKEQDAAHKKISKFPKDYTYTSIDLTLPCAIERYAVAFPSEQKFKDANIIVDGVFKITFNEDYSDQGDTQLLDILGEHRTEKEFKVMLGLLEYYHRNMYDLEFHHAEDFSQYVSKVIAKILASEVLSGFENKTLDLIGSYADKTREILHTIYPKSTTKEIWQIAQRDNLISSAENMQHFLNIRNLLRHQWDSLTGSNKFAVGNSNKNDKLREEYLASYHLLLDKPLSERIKGYQKITQQLQPLLMTLYPEFIVRQTGESNSKFVKRIKQWQKENPNKTPLINGNYLLKDDKHASLVNNLKKVLPTAQILDDMTAGDLEKYSNIEDSYFNRTSFLKIYNRLESDTATFCKEQGVLPNRVNVWQYLKKHILSEEEYQKWTQYRQLRNNLSHNHFDETLREEVNESIKQFADDIIQIYQKIADYQLNQRKAKEKAMLKNTPQTVSKTSKKDFSPNKARKDYPVKLIYGENEITECLFDNGIIVDFNRKKVTFQDNTRLYFDAKEFNVFHFENGNKVFTDKTFAVTKFQERGHLQKIRRNETVIVAPRHKITTDKACRIAEDCIITQDNKRLITQINHSNNDGAVLTFADGTKLKATADKLILSHNNITLTYASRHNFKESYVSKNTSPTKTPFTR